MGRLAAGLVFGMLLHALLMAGSVDGAMPAHPALAERGTSQHHALCADHANGCSTVRDVSRPSAPHLPALAAPARPSQPDLGEAVEPSVAPPSRHPPDVLRALLQVYRI